MLRWDMSGFKKLFRRLDNSPQKDKAWTQIGAVYMAFLRRRFNRLSRGGGGSEWSPLAQSTKRARFRKLSKAKQKKTTVDTGRYSTSVLFNALGLGNSGSMNVLVRDGIRVGFNSYDVHTANDGMTIRKLAMIHDQGKGHNPERPIIVEPDQNTGNRMKRILTAAFEDMGRASAV